MVVRVATTRGRRARTHASSLFGAVILTGVIIVQPTPTLSASLLPSGSVNQPSPFGLSGSAVSPGALSQARAFDPAAAQFSSFWSYGAMRAIAPMIFGDFLPPTALSSSFGLSAVAPMAQSQGFDPAVSTALDSTLQPGLLTGNPAEAADFNGGSGGGAAAGSNSGAFVVGASGAVVGSSGSIVGLNGNIVSTQGTLPITSAAAGIMPSCNESAEASELQAGGEYWNGQAVSTSPVQFPKGVITGGDTRNPLGGLGLSGNPTNLPRPGPAGSWCRPAPVPFFESSPLESHIFWIAAAILIVGVVVFWLSRGIKMPTRSFDRPSLLVTKKGNLAGHFPQR